MQRPPIRLTEGKHRILIISPQPWDSIQVSKHNYAKTLAAMGNTVYFLNPPNPKWTMPKVEIESTKEFQNIHTVQLGLGFPYFLKFKAHSLFRILMKFRAKSVAKQCKPDIVWDFDNTGIYSDLRDFSAVWRIFHPVDQLGRDSRVPKNAEIVFSVGQNILDCCADNVPKHFIQHGLSGAFLELGVKRKAQMACDRPAINRPTAIGYIGDLSSTAIDRNVFQTIVTSHPEVRFEIFGPFDTSVCGIGGPNQEWNSFLRGSANCVLHGRKTPAEIVALADHIDGWLVCYNVKKDINNSCNSHKILEYLATGRVVISNRITAYDNLNLIEAPSELDSDQLPGIFSKVIDNLAEFNSAEKMTSRISYALGNSYVAQIERIECRLRELE
jgi:hypothetical protein